MADDTMPQADPMPQEEEMISLDADTEVTYWTEALGVSRENLRELVKKHGHSAKAVRAALGQH